MRKTRITSEIRFQNINCDEDRLKLDRNLGSISWVEEINEVETAIQALEEDIN